MLGAMESYKHQPGMMAEPVWRDPLTKDKFRNIVRTIVRALFDVPVFLIPLLLPFFPKPHWRNWNWWLAVLVGGIAILCVLMPMDRQPAVWLEPTIGNFVFPGTTGDYAAGANGCSTHGTGRLGLTRISYPHFPPVSYPHFPLVRNTTGISSRI